MGKVNGAVFLLPVPSSLSHRISPTCLLSLSLSPPTPLAFQIHISPPCLFLYIPFSLFHTVTHPSSHAPFPCLLSPWTSHQNLPAKENEKGAFNWPFYSCFRLILSNQNPRSVIGQLNVATRVTSKKGGIGQSHHQLLTRVSCDGAVPK
jgi:hypothetical protein